jgi:molybdopterin-binding protein
MTHLRVSEVAALLRVSDDTVRRWIDQGKLGSGRDDAGRTVVPGVDVAHFARNQWPQESSHASSARNRLEGIVTDVQRDGVMAQVEIQAGPFRLVSLMSREAADELGLEPGTPAAAVVKATTVIVEAVDVVAQ